jgi:hypothetical protein
MMFRMHVESMQAVSSPGLSIHGAQNESYARPAGLTDSDSSNRLMIIETS